MTGPTGQTFSFVEMQHISSVNMAQNCLLNRKRQFLTDMADAQGQTFPKAHWETLQRFTQNS